MNIKKVSIKSILTDKWLIGKTVKGKARGKKLGFPTINLNLNHLNVKYGVYLCELELEGKIYQGLLFYGPKLTFSEKRPAVEIYILKFQKELALGLKIEFRIKKYLRPVKKFKTKEELILQMKKDLRQLTINN